MTGMCEACGGCPCKYSKGGEVKGVHDSAYDSDDKELMGESEAGKQVRNMDLKRNAKDRAITEHHKVLGQMKIMPKPKLQGLASGGSVVDPSKAQSAQDSMRKAFGYEEGGEVDSETDNELMDMCADEFMKALETKNKKEMLESLKALILSCKE